MAQLYQPLYDPGLPSQHFTDSPGHWPLRLITLFPSVAAGSSIVCHLDHSTLLKSQNDYEALSYVWGGATLSQTIIINGREVGVTQNLAQSLHHLRHASTPRRLWIDALCMNQADTQERNSQVQRMGAIYEHASRAIVFLGPEAQQSSEAMSLLGLISRLAPSHHGGVDTLLRDDSLAKSWQALLQLFRRPWWSRAWIVQEYAVAGNVLFMCGSGELDGHVFARALENLVDYRFNALVPREHEYLIRHVSNTPIHHLWSTRCGYQDITRRYDLQALDVLYKFRGSQCSDPRDKVFSIFSLVKQDGLLTPDYTKSTEKVYMAAVKGAIQASGTLEVLTHHNRSMTSKLDLPSWCPDWTIMRGKRIRLWPNRYNAAGSFAKAKVDLAGNTLTSRGVELDRIKYLKPFESDDFKSSSYLLREIHKFIHLACQPPFQERSAVHRLDTIHRTLVAARIRPGGPQHEAVALDTGQGQRLWDAWSKQSEDVKLADYAQDAKLYADALYSALCGRSVLLTDAERVGLVDSSAQIGDQIWVFSGGQVPFCIHGESRSGGQRYYELVGECYLHGVMDGEAMSDITDEHLLQQISLV